jgi:aminopeptidase 2
VLPTNVKPVHYDLTLEPNFDDFTYEGTVVIDLDVNQDTTSISLNANELTIHSTKVTAGDQVITESPTVAHDEDSQTTKVSFDQTISKASKAKLTMTFSGILNDNMAGFYRSSFKAADGSTTYMATTQMEPTDARRAFPCFAQGKVHRHPHRRRQDDMLEQHGRGV